MASKDIGRWIQLGAHEGEDGKRHGGSPVFIENGRITKGAPSLTGRKIDSMKEAPEETSHRKELNQDKQYTKSIWAKKAREQDINPEHLHTLAEEIQAHDREHVERRKKLLKDTRDLLAHYGYNARALTTNLRSGRVEDRIPNFDLVVRTMKNRYPDQFVGHSDEDANVNDDPTTHLTDLLTAGNPEPIDSYSAYQHALDHLIELRKNHGGNESEVSDKPLWDDEPDEEPEPWDARPFQSPASPPQPQAGSPHHPAKVTAAWQRYHERDQNAKGGGLFGGESMQARAGFAKLPDGAPVLFVEGQHEGKTGRIVRDADPTTGKPRIVAEIDGQPENGLVPIDPSAIEPLAAHQSWRTDTASAPSIQGSLLTADHFLGPRRDDDEDSVPFSRTHEGDNMTRSVWDTLTPRECQQRTQRVALHYARMDADGIDPAAFAVADSLDTLLGGADPESVEQQVEDARRAVQRGDMTMEDAITNLTQSLAADPRASQRIESLVRRCLSSGCTLAQAATQEDEQPTQTPPRPQEQPLAFARSHEYSPTRFQREQALQRWRARHAAR